MNRMWGRPAILRGLFCGLVLGLTSCGDFDDVEGFPEEFGEVTSALTTAARHSLLITHLKVVESAPFALCDASTIAPEDLCESEVHGGLGDPNRPTLYGHAIAFNENQRWYYVPQQRPDGAEMQIEFLPVRAHEFRCERAHPRRKLKYGFNHRYHDSVRDALRIIRSGELGGVLNLRGV